MTKVASSVPFVLDASVTAAWLLNETDHSRSTITVGYLRTDRPIAPVMWWFETRNILVIAERRRRLPRQAAGEVWQSLRNLPVELHELPETDQVYRLAMARGLTFYDASYLELAMRLSTPLATLDHALAEAARAEGVTILRQ